MIPRTFSNAIMRNGLYVYLILLISMFSHHISSTGQSRGK